MRRQKSWLDRLSSAARWRLGAKEAGEVIADYREIVGDPPRSEEELVRELGKPLDAVKPLTTQTAYRLWLAWFTVMAVCLLAAALAPTPLSPTWPLLVYGYQEGGEWYGFHPNELVALPLLPVLELLAGTALCLVWTLRRRGEGKQPRSKGLFLCALLALAAIVLCWWGVWRVTSTPEQFMTTWIEETVQGEGISVGYRGKQSGAALALTAWLEYGGCLLMGIVGMVGLVKARMENRRWAVVYVLALTAAILSLSVIAMLGNFGDFNPLTDTFYAEWFTPYLWRFGVLTAVGLIGTGVALC